MGYQLGSSPSGSTAAGVIAIGSGTRVVTRVDSARPAAAHPAILAGVLDSPLPGTVSPGRGIEINGWIIPTSGNHVEAVLAVVAGERGPLQPLNVSRPDVVADYPAANVSDCGFSFWCSLPVAPTARIQLVSVFSSGDMIPLLDLHVAQEHTSRDSVPDMRYVDAPDFVTIGTQRGGTTSLHEYLRAHPNIQTPEKKEIHYLTDRFERGAEWYAGQFPPSVPNETLVGEATPYALFHPLAPVRLHDVAPAAKLIVLLRNPVDRAYSHFLHERACGHESLSFEEALAAEPNRLTGLEARLASGELLTSDIHKRASYAARGRYAGQLERWFTVFPREDLLIIRSEDLYVDPAAAMRRVTDFLDLQPLTSALFTPHNATAGPPMLAETRAQLTRGFAPDNARLAEMLGWNPGWA